MSVQEARAIMERTKGLPSKLELIKKEAARKAVIKVNVIMARVTKLVADKVKDSVGKKIEAEIGRSSKKMADIVEAGKQLEEKGRKIDEMQKKGKPSSSELIA